MPSGPLLEVSSEVEILEVGPADDLLRRVIDLGNGPAKQTLGPLPDEAFEDRARRGTLLAATKDEQLLGYVLFDLPSRHHNVTIRQLCVAPDAQEQGVARRLVAAVSERHRDRKRIDLWCRDSYELDGMWRALDFRPQGSRRGRSKEGHRLTAWVLDLEGSSEPTLFDEYQAERAIAALDHNVFLDLHIDVSQRPQAAESRYLLEEWVADHVELCVTDEVFHEIRGHPDAEEQSIEWQWVDQYRKISKPNDGWKDLEAEVASLAPRVGAADHRHVARAVAAGADYLVSRDRDLLDAAEAIESALGLAVLSPAALIVRLDRMRADDPYQPVALQGTELKETSPVESLQEEILSSLLNNSTGERRAELASRLRPILADRTNHEVRIVKAADGRIIAGIARRTAGQRLEIPFLRVAHQRGSIVVARQLVFAQRKLAADLKLEEALITDPHPSKDVREALPAENFEEGAEGWVSHVKRGLIEVGQIDLQHPSPMTPSQYEDRFWPVKILGAGVQTYLVPIKSFFAEELLDAGLAEQSLLPRQLGLGLNREHVYYRKPQNDRGIAAGDRILWYVRGGVPAHRRGNIRAISQVADVVVGRPRTLHARFERFGVYSLEQVLDCADRNGNVMAIRFMNTEILQRPIDLDDLKALGAEQGERFLAPQSPTLISEHMFRLIYRRSSAYAS
jgi:ribosomal protein S18 acetylase RimI-like enzyme/predicted nucleic acid-binding protein